MRIGNWKEIENWKILSFLPLLIGLARIIHFSYTHYFLPDEATYLACVLHYFNDGKLLFYGPRQLFQFAILGISILFNLNTPEKYIPFFAMISSIIASLTIFLSVKITQKEVPDFKEFWVIPLLFMLSPAFDVVSGLILTEIYGVFFAILTIYVFVHRNNTFHVLLIGLFSGLSYHYREPLFVISVYIVLHFLYHKKIKHIIAYLLTFAPFFGRAIVRLSVRTITKINLPVETTRPALPQVILETIGGELGDVQRLGGLTWDMTSASIPTFIRTTFLDFGVMLLFSLGIFSTILIFYGLYKKKVNRVVLLSFVLMVVSSMYLSRYNVYARLFFVKISTVIRYGVMGVFCIPFIPSFIIEWDKKKIKRYALIAVVFMSILFVPFTTFVQSNLSSNHISRLDIFNYQSPWLILRDTTKTKNESNVMVICEPLTRVRFYVLASINYATISDWYRWAKNRGIEQETFWLTERELINYDYKRFDDEKFTKLFVNMISRYSHVYLYGEKYSLYESVLESQIPWYWAFLENSTNYDVVYENAEMYLFKVIQ